MFCGAATLLVAATLAAMPPSVPRVRISGSQIDVSLPPSILKNAAMQKQLTSGLTTVFITSVDERSRAGQQIRGAARIEIRFELWEEKFLVNTIDIAARRESRAFDNFDKLAEWWQAAWLHIADVKPDDAPASIGVKAEVVPFSAAEEADAQQWLLHSLAEPGASRASSTRDNASAHASVLDVIIGTGVRRRPTQSWRWTVRLASVP